MKKGNVPCTPLESEVYLKPTLAKKVLPSSQNCRLDPKEPAVQSVIMKQPIFSFDSNNECPCTLEMLCIAEFIGLFLDDIIVDVHGNT